MEEKKVVIIGGTGQIGKCIVKAMQAEGYITVCVSSKPLPDTEKNEGTKYYVYDMSKPKNIEECCDVISKEFGVVDGLINVLGKNRAGDFGEITEEMWDDVIDANLKSVFFICQIFKKIFCQNSKGMIINFASTAGIRALPVSPHYIAAKAGVIALTKYFAKVLAPCVKVNCIAPGFVLTKEHEPEVYENYAKIIEDIPLHQMASIEEIAAATVYLMKTINVTGQTLVVDGGLIL